MLPSAVSSLSCASFRVPSSFSNIQKMPRSRAAAVAKPVEPVKPVEPEPEDIMEEEEVEYEEVEEEVEVEEEEDDEEEEDTMDANGVVADENHDGDDMKDDKIDGNESEKHAELLALPPHGSEVYIGSIPEDTTEEDLKTFCESVGEVVEVRMLKSSDKKCYAFVTFRNQELATKAIKDLHNTEFNGRNVRCSTSQAKHRLFIGNIPKDLLEDDMKKAVRKVGPGVNSVQLMMDTQNSRRNRGYAFIEYYNHACAEYSRKKMSNPEFKLDGNDLTVSWADPRSGDSSSTSQVKAIYVKRLPKDVTQDQLKKLFQHHGQITKVVLPPTKSGQENRIGFVHFLDRSMAMKALKNTERYELDGQLLECSLARPPAEEKGDIKSGSSQRGPLLPNYQQGMGYPMMSGAYPAGFVPPMMYGRGPGMGMMPTRLPDGRLAYVMPQTVATPPQRSGNGRSGNSSGGRKNSDESGGRRFHPY